MDPRLQMQNRITDEDDNSNNLTRGFIEHITPHCLEKQGHRHGLQAATLIGHDEVE